MATPHVAGLITRPGNRTLTFSIYGRVSVPTEWPSPRSVRGAAASCSLARLTGLIAGPAPGRRAFCQRLTNTGAVVAKIDSLDHDPKEVVDRYPTLLRESAECPIKLDFHGSKKPTGEPRTWPNALGREGVCCLEHKGITGSIVAGRAAAWYSSTVR